VYASTYTPTDISAKCTTHSVEVSCHCQFCPKKHSSGFPYCCKECLGMDESELTEGYGSMFKISENRKCTHIHSKCLVPDCNVPREFYIMNTGTRKQLNYPQPFCGTHLPKCKCGLPRFTSSKLLIKYPISEEDSKLFNSECFKCFSPYSVEEKDDALTTQMKKDLAQLLDDFLFLKSEPLYTFINEHKIFIHGKTIDDYKKLCLNSYAEAIESKKDTLIKVFQNHIANVAKLRTFIPALAELS